MGASSSPIPKITTPLNHTFWLQTPTPHYSRGSKRSSLQSHFLPWSLDPSPFFLSRILPFLFTSSYIISLSFSTCSLLFYLGTCFRIFYLRTNKQTKNYKKSCIFPHSPPDTALFISSPFPFLFSTFQPTTLWLLIVPFLPWNGFIKAKVFMFPVQHGFLFLASLEPLTRLSITSLTLSFSGLLSCYH